MDPATLVKLMIVSGIALNVVSIGVRARPGNALALLRRPELAVRSLTAMFLFVPAFVLVMSVMLGLSGPVPGVLLALSVAPMPPLISNKELDAGGDPEYAIGLQVLATIFSIAVMPLMIMLAGLVFGRSDNFYPAPMVMVLMITVLAPMVIGMTLGHFLPQSRAAIATWAGRIGWTALGLGVVALLVARGAEIITMIGNGTLLICMVVAGAALTIGHLLGGPKEGNRRALAITCAARHPGVAISVVTPLMPDAAGAVLGMAGLYWVVSFAMTIPYLRWRSARAAS